MSKLRATVPKPRAINDWNKEIEKINPSLDFILNFPTLKCQNPKKVRTYLIALSDKVPELNLNMLSDKWQVEFSEIRDLYKLMSLDCPMSISEKKKFMETHEEVTYTTVDKNLSIIKTESKIVEKSNMIKPEVEKKKAKFYIGKKFNIIDLFNRCKTLENRAEVLRSICEEGYSVKQLSEMFKITKTEVDKLLYYHGLIMFSNEAHIKVPENYNYMEFSRQALKSVKKDFNSAWSELCDTTSEQRFAMILNIMGIKKSKKSGYSIIPYDEFIKSLQEKYSDKKGSFPMTKELEKKYPKIKEEPDLSSFSEKAKEMYARGFRCGSLITEEEREERRKQEITRKQEVVYKDEEFLLPVEESESSTASDFSNMNSLISEFQFNIENKKAVLEQISSLIDIVGKSGKITLTIN